MGNGSKIELIRLQAAIIADGYAVLIGMEMYGIVLSDGETGQVRSHAHDPGVPGFHRDG